MREIKKSDVGSLDAILGDLNLDTPADRSMITTGGAAVAIWLPRSFKERYDRLQSTTNREFSKKARLALCALIECAEARGVKSA